MAAGLLCSCNLSTDTGYVEIKTTMAPSLSDVYSLNSELLTAFKEGHPVDLVLREPVGPAVLTVQRDDQMYTLCRGSVVKNRIVTMTVSIVEDRLHCTVE
jgi:hypothetical protein